MEERSKSKFPMLAWMRKKSEMKFEKKLETKLKVYMDQKEDTEKRKKQHCHIKTPGTDW